MDLSGLADLGATKKKKKKGVKGPVGQPGPVGPPHKAPSALPTWAPYAVGAVGLGVVAWLVFFRKG